jgi:DNA-binding NtrC family response regulator
LIQEAKDGTLFLDELDEAPDSLQALIKRVVQFGVFNVVGDPTESKSNTRFVAATNVVDAESLAIKKDLKDRFLVLRVPPLREHRGDIRPLAQKFAAAHARVIPEPALVFLERLDWPGNVRQLQNVVDRACARGKGELTLEMIQQAAVDGGALAVAAKEASSVVPLGSGETLEMRLATEERRLIKWALEFCRNNQSHAARVLDISRQSIQRRIKRFGL